MGTFASIDLGTNSVRMLVAKAVYGKVTPLNRYLKITRIGEKLEFGQPLDVAAKKRTITALQECAVILDRYQLDGCWGVATSALRDAADGDEFLKQVENETGLELEVITGRREAELSFEGAVKGLGRDPCKAVVIDIGGGSTEITYFTEKGELVANSCQLGAVRCTQNYYTPAKISAVLACGLGKQLLGEKELIGVGGTVTTFAAIIKKLAKYHPDLVHGAKLSFNEVVSVNKYLSELTLDQRKSVTGLQPQRADIIVSGGNILCTLMRLIAADTITVSESDMLYGLIGRGIKHANY